MNMIAAVDKNWGIGKDNGLLDHIPEDMKFFRETTKGKAVIMGRKTFLSFPNQKPLPNRLNIVLSSDKSFCPEGAKTAETIEKAVEIARETYADDDIFIIGGEAVYFEMEPLCKRAYITKIENVYEADKFFPCLDEKNEWTIKHKEMLKTEKGLWLTFVTYEKES